MPLVYQVNKPFTAAFERKGKVGLWAKKYLSLHKTTASLHETEGGAVIATLDLKQVIQAEDGNPLVLTLSGDGDVSELVLRALDRETADDWYNLLYTALELSGRAKKRDVGLPPNDPRFGIPFVSVPAEFRHRFVSLASAVLYFFSPVTKHSAPKLMMAKTESRVLFCSDKAFYVTRHDSQLTRCAKISSVTEVFVGGEGTSRFVVVKTTENFDLHVSCETIDTFVEVLKSVWASIHKAPLSVTEVPAASDSRVKLQLSRPSEFDVLMVIPTDKAQLKRALDSFAQRNGLSFSATGSAHHRTEEEAVAEVDGDSLTQFLAALGLECYAEGLIAQQVDLEVLGCMESDDYANFGITDPEHIALIQQRLAEGYGEGYGEGYEEGCAEAEPEVEDLDIAPPPAIAAEDLDDDLLVAQPSGSHMGPIVLDSDDDLDLPPPRPVVERGGVTIDEDEL